MMQTVYVLTYLPDASIFEKCEVFKSIKSAKIYANKIITKINKDWTMDVDLVEEDAYWCSCDHGDKQAKIIHIEPKEVESLDYVFVSLFYDEYNDSEIISVDDSMSNAVMSIRESIVDLDEYELDLETDNRVEYGREDHHNVQVITILKKKVRD